MRGSGERINQKSESSRIQQFFYAGYSHAEFRKYREQIAEGNRSVLHSFCLVGLSVSLGLLIISAIPSSVLSQSTGFFALSVLFGTVSIVTNSSDDSSSAVIHGVIHAFTLSLYAILILIDTYELPHTNAVSFIVMIALLPQLFVEIPYRTGLRTGIMSLLFVYCTWQFKETDLAINDTINTLVFYSLGLLMSHRIVNYRLSDLIARQELFLQKSTDGLTRLNNRIYCENAIDAYIRMTKRPGIFMILDLDDFKYINDHCGHDSGDVVLIEVSKAIRNHLRFNDIIGRLGGDEFIAFLPACRDTDVLKMKLDAINAEIRNISIDDPEYKGTSSSIGYCSYPKDGNTFLELYHKADDALYKAKQDGKNKCVAYTSENE